MEGNKNEKVGLYHQLNWGFRDFSGLPSKINHSRAWLMLWPQTRDIV